MKKNIIMLLIPIVCFLVNRCSEVKDWSDPLDSKPPGVVTITNVENIPGGAIIYYEIPWDDDFLCVEAVYTINETEYNLKSSLYYNNIKIEGFAEEKDYLIKLFSIDNSGNKSESVDVTINPLKSPLTSVFETIELTPSFGGAKVSWQNDTEAYLIVNVSMIDYKGEWVELENFYTSAKNGFGFIRGLDTIPKTLGIKIRDRWDNYSELLEKTVKPLYEVELDKSKFEAVLPILPNDILPYNANYPLSKMWNNIIAQNNECFVTFTEENAINRFITFDLGQTVVLSRYKMWQRLRTDLTDDLWTYKVQNLKHYKIYGCTEITDGMRETGSLDGWSFLYDAHSYKPSGEGPLTDEDREYALRGDEHEFPDNIPPVRFIRIQFLETWGNRPNVVIGEVSFWGSIL